MIAEAFDLIQKTLIPQSQAMGNGVLAKYKNIVFRDLKHHLEIPHAVTLKCDE